MILFSEAVGLQVYSVGLPNRDAVKILHFHFPIQFCSVFLEIARIFCGRISIGTV